MFQELLARGLPFWWFDADAVQARISFLKRKRRSVDEFDQHAGAIYPWQKQLQLVYGVRFLRTLHTSALRLPLPDIWDYIKFVERW